MTDDTDKTDPAGAKISDAELDRLVDGELSPSEYRQLLLALDVEPGGWQRCAHAFLESQAWRRELSLAAPAAELLPRSKRETTPTQLAHFILSVAAAFAIAFLLGVAYRTAQHQRSNSSPAAEPPRVANAPSVEGDDSAPAEAAAAPQTWGHLTFEVDRGDGTNQEFELPVLGLQSIDRSWIDQVNYLPPEVIDDFQRLGYEVHRDVRWEPIEIDRGRRVFVPLGEFDIRPVSRVVY